MKNTPFEALASVRLPKEVQLRRVRLAIREGLTQKQQEVFIGYYYLEKNIPTLARELGVNKSSVCRLLKRAERRISRLLKY